jgi:hypothetical protein
MGPPAKAAPFFVFASGNRTVELRCDKQEPTSSAGGEKLLRPGDTALSFDE